MQDGRRTSFVGEFESEDSGSIEDSNAGTILGSPWIRESVS